MELKQFDVVLCEFYFSYLNKIKKSPVLVFKDNLPYDDFVGIPISSDSFIKYNNKFCLYFGCNNEKK